jgi:hypothetical protein
VRYNSYSTNQVLFKSVQSFSRNRTAEAEARKNSVSESLLISYIRNVFYDFQYFYIGLLRLIVNSEPLTSPLDISGSFRNCIQSVGFLGQRVDTLQAISVVVLFKLVRISY